MPFTGQSGAGAFFLLAPLILHAACYLHLHGRRNLVERHDIDPDSSTGLGSEPGTCVTDGREPRQIREEAAVSGAVRVADCSGSDPRPVVFIRFAHCPACYQQIENAE
jgi:hypothetical protein